MGYESGALNIPAGQGAFGGGGLAKPQYNNTGVLDARAIWDQQASWFLTLSDLIQYCINLVVTGEPTTIDCRGIKPGLLPWGTTPLSIQKPSITILWPGGTYSAVTGATPAITVGPIAASGCRLIGPSPLGMGQAGGGAGFQLTATGSGGCLVVGTSASQNEGFYSADCMYAVSNSAGISIRLNNARFWNLHRVRVTGNNGVTTQIGILLDGTGTYCGSANITGCLVNAHFTGISLVSGGGGVNGVNAVTITGTSFSGPVAAGSTAWLSDAGQHTGNSLFGGDIAFWDTGIFDNSVSPSGNGFYSPRFEANTTWDVRFGAATVRSVCHCQVGSGSQGQVRASSNAHCVIINAKRQSGRGADSGDNSITVEAGLDFPWVVYGTPLGGNRTITLNTANAVNGDTFHVVRTAAATGASTLTIGAGLKVLAVGQWAIVKYNGGAWELVAFGSL